MSFKALKGLFLMREELEASCFKTTRYLIRIEPVDGLLDRYG